MKPGTDFYLFANGTWYAKAEIPADRSSTGVFMRLTEEVEKRTKDLLEEAARSGAPAGSTAQKIGDYYASYLDAAGIEQRGLKPVQPLLDRVAAIGDRKALARFLGSTLRADVDALNATNFYTDNVLGLWVAQDLDHPGRYAAFFLQGGLDMPDREYYLRPDGTPARARSRYAAHVEAMLALLGERDAAAQASFILYVETTLARGSLPASVHRDPLRTYHRLERAGLAARAPHFAWDTYLEALGRPDVQAVNVAVPPELIDWPAASSWAWARPIASAVGPWASLS